MAKIPYLFRRKNIYYFRIRIPAECQNSLKVREIVQSLRTENRAEAIPLALKLASNITASLNHLRNSDSDGCISHSELIQRTHYTSALNDALARAPSRINAKLITTSQPSAPLLSFVIDDFLKRYNPNNKATLTKLTATLPVFLELLTDKPINQILQADINAYFDDVQKLPVRRDAKIFAGMSTRETISANTGKCISEGTFGSTYRACVSIFINWVLICTEI